MPKPGQGMDPVQAMLNGIGPDPLGAGGPPPGPSLGPGGMPVGGSLPPMSDGDEDDDMGGSSLLKVLAGSVGGGDPYNQPPFGPDQGFQGVGTGDPGMGLQQMFQALALSQMGVGGAGNPGADLGGPPSPLGLMAGF
jgi:hypothetical protein